MPESEPKVSLESLIKGNHNSLEMPQLRGESLVATTNALVAFVVDRCAGEGKPTIAAESAAIVATNAIPFRP